MVLGFIRGFGTIKTLIIYALLLMIIILMMRNVPYVGPAFDHLVPDKIFGTINKKCEPEVQVRDRIVYRDRTVRVPDNSDSNISNLNDQDEQVIPTTPLTNNTENNLDNPNTLSGVESPQSFIDEGLVAEGMANVGPIRGKNNIQKKCSHDSIYNRRRRKVLRRLQKQLDERLDQLADDFPLHLEGENYEGEYETTIEQFRERDFMTDRFLKERYQEGYLNLDDQARLEDRMDKSNLNFYSYCPDKPPQGSDRHNYIEKEDYPLYDHEDSVDRVNRLVREHNTENGEEFKGMKISELYDTLTGANSGVKDTSKCIIKPNIDQLSQEGFYLSSNTHLHNTFKPDNWAYKNEKPMNGGHIENNLYAYDPNGELRPAL